MTFDRQAVRQALPPGVTLEMVHSPTLDKKETVEKELIRIGAHVDSQGAMRDATGKEIRFEHEPRPQGGAWFERVPSPEDAHKQVEYEWWHKNFTVIHITWNQNFEPLPP